MSVTTLTAPPSLRSLYARAALLGPLFRPLFGPLPRGDTLPGTELRLADQTIDPAQLAGYQRLCGFRVSAVLPPTYLHVLAFPMTMALLLERDFPFPLLGLVHVANEITVHRAVSAQEAVSFSVRAAQLRPHPAGQQFDVLVQARVGSEPVWTGRSTYLRRAGSTRDGAPRGPVAVPVAAQVAEPSGPVALVRVPGNIGRRYAALSGDRNPIHLSGLTAKAFGFPRAIAHGMWLTARTLATLEGRLPAAVSVAVAFKTPVLLPSTVAITSSRNADGWQLAVRADRSGKPHLSGTVRVG